jgi:hypothetical protein
MVPEDLRAAIGAIVGVVALVVIAGGARAVGGRARLSWVAGFVAWLVISGLLAHRGVFARTSGPPVFPVFVIGGLVAAVVIARSRIGAQLTKVPLAALIALQAFRLPLELAMHHGAGRGIPVELTLAGFNFDIVTGVGAVVVAGLVALDRCPAWLVWVWSAIGLCCLLVIFVIAAATLPRVHAFGLEPEHLNTWAAHVPFVWVPVLLVPVAFGGHLVILRAIARRSS